MTSDLTQSRHPLPEEAPALGVIELASLARGAVVVDAIVKRSPVHLHTARRVSRGKYLILFQGGVAEVEEGFNAGLEAASDQLVDRLFLPQAHDQIHAGLVGSYPDVEIDSLGTFETDTAASALASLDAALKATEIDLVGVHLCVGIGGKGHWVVSGRLYAIEEAIDVARRTVAVERVISGEIVAAPHPEAIEVYVAPWRG